MKVDEMASYLAETLNGSRLSGEPNFREMIAKAHGTKITVTLDDGQEFELDIVRKRRPPRAAAERERARHKSSPRSTTP